MSRTLAGDASLIGFFERRILPVATVVNAMPSAGATRARSVRTAVSAGYVCPPSRRP